MNGSISGGWGFVIAAYGITIAVLTIYCLQLVVRHRKGTQQ
jgi:hypothetical protein